jgi:hypothetical protein
MMGHSQFDTPATLGADSTIEVQGPLTVDPPARWEDVAFRFLIVQGSVVVEGKGQGVADGRWRGTATARPGSLDAAAALAIGLATVVNKETPGFETFTWSEQINLKPAKEGG